MASRHQFLAFVAAWAVASAYAGPGGELAAVETRALAGDYQAQRNLAYGYTSAPYAGQAKNPLAGCAWRVVIIQSGHASVDTSDVSNEQLYCGRLNPTERAAAMARARKLYEQVYKRQAKF